jgi:hypothetical protein
MEQTLDLMAAGRKRARFTIPFKGTPHVARRLHTRPHLLKFPPSPSST